MTLKGYSALLPVNVYCHFVFHLNLVMPLLWYLAADLISSNFNFFKKKCFLEKNNYISSDQSLSVLSSRTVFQWESRSEQCGTVSPFPANKSSLYTRTSLGMV